MTKKKYLYEDISDSPEDQEKLKPDQGMVEIPELADIPGAKRSGKNINTVPEQSTLSSTDEESDESKDEEGDESTDEEGEELFGGNIVSSENDVSPLEKKLLNESFDSAYDNDLPVDSISLDEEDDEGELLEEAAQSGDLFGKDLDDELLKEEDEESDGESQQ